MRQLGVEGDGADGDQQQADGVREHAEGAGTEQVLKGHARRQLLVGVLVQLLIVAFHQLNAMRHGPGDNQKGDDQAQRVEVVAEQRDNAESPDAGDQNPGQRDQHPVGLAEIKNQQGDHDQGGKEENLNDLVEVLISPAHQHRLAGDMNAQARRRFLAAQLLNLLKGLGVIELAFVQLRLDQRHVQVRRHQRAVDQRVGDHVLAKGGKAFG